jgi:uncharacterized protein YdhG (YjbR/CyaY superfamily)
MPIPTTIDEYLAALPAEQRATLEKLRVIIRAALPNADETIGYRVPVFKLGGKGVVGFSAHKEHCDLLTMGYIPEAVAGDLKGYELGKGSIKFPIGKPPPAALVKKIIKAKLAELGR